MNQIIIPRSEILRKHIASIDIFKEFENPNQGFTYFAFPQSGTEILFYDQCDIFIGENEVSYNRNPSKPPSILRLGKYLTPIKVTYKSYIPKMAIHFKEAGVINFFPNFFSDYDGRSVQHLSVEKFNLRFDLLFSENTEERINYLENYLLDLYSPNSLPEIERAVEMLKEDSSIMVEELAEQLFMNKKTFSRQFKKHIGCTVSQYTRITRFNQTARNYFKTDYKKLVQLCYDNGYYDASDFYKQIRKTTSLNPKEFFKSISSVGPKNRIYLFE